MIARLAKCGVLPIITKVRSCCSNTGHPRNRCCIDGKLGKQLRCRAWSCASVASWHCTCNQPQKAAPKAKPVKHLLPSNFQPQSRTGAIPDGAASSEADPVGDRSVLVGLLGQGPLGAEGLLGWLQIPPQTQHTNTTQESDEFPRNKTANEHSKHNRTHTATHAEASAGLSSTQKAAGCIENQAQPPPVKTGGCSASFRAAQSRPPSIRPRRSRFCHYIALFAVIYPPLSSNRLDSTHWFWPRQGGGPMNPGHPPGNKSILDDARVS